MDDNNIKIDIDSFDDNITEISNAAKNIKKAKLNPDDDETKGFTANDSFHAAFETDQGLMTTLNELMVDFSADLDEYKEAYKDVNAQAESAAEGE